MTTASSSEFLPKPSSDDPTSEKLARSSQQTGNRSFRIARLAALAVIVGAGSILAARYALRAKPPKLQYQTALVERGAMAAKVSANGTLSALVTVSVGSQVSGRIESLAADFGSKVLKGQVVARIEPSLFRAAAAQANANYRAALAGVERAKAQNVNAQRQYERARLLLADGLTTGSDFDVADANLKVTLADLAVAQSNVQQTRAARDQAELNLRYTTIVSPIDGIVISRNVDVGQTVAAALQAPTLFTIAQDLTRMQVDTNVSEADVGKISQGMPVAFSVDSYPGRAFLGKVRQVRDNAQTIQNVVTYDAVVDVNNGERLLKPGMTANVTFTYAERASVVRIPNTALRFRPDPATLAAMWARPLPSPRSDERTLWLLEKNTVRPLNVKIGITDGVSSELLSNNVLPGEVAVAEASLEGAKRSP